MMPLHWSLSKRQVIQLADDIEYEKMDQFDIVEYLRAGTESLVFKAIKRNVGRTYALKFQMKGMPTQKAPNGVKYQEFENYIKPIYQKLEECSVSHIAGLIKDVPQEYIHMLFACLPEEELEYLRQRLNENEPYFCIIEDFIQGCNLAQYCHGDARRNIPAHCPKKDADYAQVQAYEKMIFTWIEQFCDIMEQVTDKMGIIHLDIKPENIMVAADTKSLVLIDFGASMYLDADGTFDLHQNVFSQNSVMNLKKENIEVTNIGSPDYAAPEAYYEDANNRPDFPKELCGKVSQRSDIFSFGATLWNCLTPDLIVLQSISPRQYYNRDLFSAPKGYSSHLEQILLKCTRKEPIDRFATFSELKRTAVEAEKTRPTSYRNKMTQRILVAVAVMTLLFGLLFLPFSIRSSSLTVQIAEKSLHDIGNNDVAYNVKPYQTAAENLLDARADKNSYDQILQTAFARQEEGQEQINSDIASVLMICLKKTDDASIIRYYVDTIMEKAESSSVSNIAGIIASNEQVKNLSIDGTEPWYSRDLANARKRLSNGENLGQVYDTLLSVYEDDTQREKYKNVLYSIASAISKNSKYKESIEQIKGISSQALTQKLEEIMAKTQKEAASS